MYLVTDNLDQVCSDEGLKFLEVLEDVRLVGLWVNITRFNSLNNKLDSQSIE